MDKSLIADYFGTSGETSLSSVASNPVIKSVVSSKEGEGFRAAAVEATPYRAEPARKLFVLGLVIVLVPMLALAQTHTMPGSNVVPSGASLTIQSGGSITAAAGSTVTGFGAGGGAPTTSTYITQTPDAGLSAELALSTLSTGLLKSTTTTGALTTITDNSTNWNTAFTQTRQWDGGSTGLTATTGRTSLGGTTVGQNFFTLTNPSAITFPEISATNVVSTKTAAQMQTDLGLVIGTNVQAFNANLTTWAGITAPSGTVVGTTDTQTLTNKRVSPRVTSIATNATWAPSATTDDVYEITAQNAAVTTISNPAGTPVDGQSLIIRFTDNGTPRALTWSGTQWDASAGVALPTTTLASATDYVGFKWNSATSKWTAVASSQAPAVINAGTGFTVNGAAVSGKVLIGNGTNFVTSTSTFSDAPSTALKWMRSDGTNWITSTSLLSDTPSTALKWLRSNGTNWITSTSLLSDTPSTAGKILQSDGTNWITSTATWPTTNTAGYKVQSNGTNYVDYPTDIEASSTATVSSSYAADTYLAGSMVTLAAGDWKAQGQYHCRFDMTKTAAGTATPIITVRMGTLGTTGDAAIGTLTFAAGTGVVDTGIFDVDVVFRSVGSGTSAVIQMMGECGHLLGATGITATGAAGTGIIVGTSSGFNSTTQTKIGISFNGGSSFVGTNTIVIATLHQP